MGTARDDGRPVTALPFRSIIRVLPPVLLAAALLLATSACSDSDDEPEAAATTTAPAFDGSTPEVLSDLLDKGAHECEDVEGDLTVSARAITEPPVPLPGLDLLAARSTLDDDFLTVTFELAGTPDPATQPELVFFIGLVDDLNGFEVQASQAEGAWIAQLATRGTGVNRTQPLPSGRVVADADTVTVTVPRIDVPSVGPNQPVAYGTSGVVVDETGALLDAAGEPVEKAENAARAFEECLSFGQ